MNETTTEPDLGKPRSLCHLGHGRGLHWVSDRRSNAVSLMMHLQAASMDARLDTSRRAEKRGAR